MSPLKRCRSENAAVTTSPSRDCFVEVFAADSESVAGNHHDGQEDVVRSSWLKHIDWLSHGPTGDTIIVGATTSDPAAIIEDTGAQDLHVEIDALNRQLLQVKRRLGPAAERCMEAVNAAFEKSITTGHVEFVHARRDCNPYEWLGEPSGGRGGLNAHFINRSAIKLANIDAMLGFPLVQPDPMGYFVFVDLCGAPGGFSEYLVHRCGRLGIQRCVGVGMSLHGRNENGAGLTWKLEDTDMTLRGGITQVQYKVRRGMDGTGDVFRWSNVESLQGHLNKAAMMCGNNSKAHLVVADGGFDAQRDCEQQEGVTQKLVICETAAALSLLAKGGTFVFKAFGFQTASIQELMLQLHDRFDHVCALKPISSRPASAERYVVCLSFRGLPVDWQPNRWQDHILLASHNNKKSSCALNYMNAFERDILILNHKACFAILSRLENKCRIYTSSPSNTSHVDTEAAQVHIQAYKHAWQL